MTDYTEDHQVVFIGGLHRSGTTLLGRCLSAHPEVSGFEDTGVKEDEGQHLQTVYPPAREYGGPGRFALNDRAHLTEDSPLVTDADRELLLSQWARHWDLSRSVLVEKSPSNLVSARFLQAMVPGSKFVMIVRHPMVVALSTRKWTHGLTVESLLRHWFRAHDLFLEDAQHLASVHVVKYEDLIGSPVDTLGEVAAFLGLDGTIPADLIRGDRSTSYEKAWYRMRGSMWPWHRARSAVLRRRYETRVRAYGYSLDDLSVVRPFPI